MGRLSRHISPTPNEALAAISPYLVNSPHDEVARRSHTPLGLRRLSRISPYLVISRQPRQALYRVIRHPPLGWRDDEMPKPRALSLRGNKGQALPHHAPASRRGTRKLGRLNPRVTHAERMARTRESRVGPTPLPHRRTHLTRAPRPAKGAPMRCLGNSPQHTRNGQNRANSGNSSQPTRCGNLPGSILGIYEAKGAGAAGEAIQKNFAVGSTRLRGLVGCRPRALSCLACCQGCQGCALCAPSPMPVWAWASRGRRLRRAAKGMPRQGDGISSLK